MWDDIIAGTTKVIKNYGGPYGAMLVIAAILFPILTIAAGTGYAWGWSIIHILLFLLVAGGAYVLLLQNDQTIPYLCVTIHPTPPLVRKVLLPLACAGTVVLALGILNITKPIAVIIGLIFGQIGLFYIVFVSSAAVLAFGFAVAAATKEVVSDAEKREERVHDRFFVIAAWECVVAWFITALGEHLSLYSGTCLILAAGFIMYGGIAWNFGGDFGRKAVYYLAIAVVVGITLHTIYQIPVAAGYTVPIKWANVQQFLSDAADIHKHTLGWFIAITSVLALGFVISQLTGKTQVWHTAILITLPIVGIFFLVWLVWGGGRGILVTELTTVAKHDLPPWEVWHGIVRMLFLITAAPILVFSFYRFYKGGLFGFVGALTKLGVFILLPWFLTEMFIWRWSPYVAYKLGLLGDGFITSIPFLK